MFPFRVLRKDIKLVLIPALPIIFLMIFLIFNGSGEPQMLLNDTDSYLGGTLFLSAADLTAYNELSTNIQLPLIRLGGIAEKTSIGELVSGSNPANFILIFTILTLGFLSYSLVSRAVYNMVEEKEGSMILGINGPSIILSLLASFLILFIASFALAGFKLLLVLSFGAYFTFSIPYAAAGQPLGESIFSGFGFLSKNMPKMVSSYIGSMGIAIMAPVALLIFTTPILLNLDSPIVTTLLRIFLGLFAVVFALFYQMCLCAGAVFTTKEQVV